MDKNFILETERLYLRKMAQSDYASLCKILRDEETMYAYNGAFSDTETQGITAVRICRIICIM